MLNRTVAATTILETPIRSHKKVCLPFMTSSRGSPSISSAINNTDAILLEAHDCVVSQSQKSSRSSRIAAAARAPAANHKLTPKTTGPNSSLQRSHTKNKLQRNSKTNYNSDNHCLRRKTSPELFSSKMLNHLYYLSACLLALGVFSFATLLANAEGTLQQNLQKLKVSPDLIGPYDYASTIKVELHNSIVKPGDVVPVKHFKDLNLAKITWDVSDPRAKHTLLLVDLDRKSANSNSSSIFNQYLNLNVKGSNINTGQTIVAFDTPTVPCQPSAKHRLLLLAYKQDVDYIDLLSVAHLSAPSGELSERRENFKLAEFLKQFKLELVAANVFSVIGESNGVCSGSTSLHSIQSISSILIAMVILIPAYGLHSRQRQVN